MSAEVIGMTFRRDELALVLEWYAGSHSTGDPDLDAASDDLSERFKAAYRHASAAPAGHRTP